MTIAAKRVPVSGIWPSKATHGLRRACLRCRPVPGYSFSRFMGFSSRPRRSLWHSRSAAGHYGQHVPQLSRAFREHRYRFVSPAEAVAGLDPSGKYAMISFDDGYANNRRAFPRWKNSRFPCSFRSQSIMCGGKTVLVGCVVSRSTRARVERQTTRRRAPSLKRLRTCEIEQRLVAGFGEKGFQTVSDTDRPFTPDELAGFARHPLVDIGNHTCDHAILTNYPLPDVGDEIGWAQDWLRGISGQTPQAIAYPNGNVSQLVLRTVQDVGIPLGLTGQPGRNSIASARGNRALLLKRHTLWGTQISRHNAV